jgi:hypothetical protein
MRDISQRFRMCTKVTTNDRRGVTPSLAPGYNNVGMISDAPPKSQFAPARVLAPLPSVPATLSGSVAVAFASQPIW